MYLGLFVDEKLRSAETFKIFPEAGIIWISFGVKVGGAKTRFAP